jgi:4-amino-4-deoxychorismate lyase
VCSLRSCSLQVPNLRLRLLSTATFGEMSSQTFGIFTSLRSDPSIDSGLTSLERRSFNQNEGPLYIFSYHRDRLLFAADHFGWTDVVDRLQGEHGIQWLKEQVYENWPSSILEYRDYYSGKIPLKDLPDKASGPSVALRLKIVIHEDAALTIEGGKTLPIELTSLFPSAQAFLTSHSAARHTIWDIYLDPNPTQPTPFTTFKTTNRNMYDESRARAGIHTFDKTEEVIIHSPDGKIMEGSLTSVYFYRKGKWVTPDRDSGGQMGTTRRWALEQGYCEEGVVEVDTLVEGEEMWISNGVRGFLRGIYRGIRSGTAV